jgi:hypothetical protein
MQQLDLSSRQRRRRDHIECHECSSVLTLSHKALSQQQPRRPAARRRGQCASR